MESSKNIINGTIETNGGDVVNGNNNTIVNFIDSLSFLLTEYREQLNQIHVLILAFKPKTALGLLTNLENRIKESNAKKDNKITSKLLYLKALCKRELEDFTKEDSAQDFIKAYNLNIEDETIKYRACIEYLNLGDSAKAINLADDILISDEYNGTAWIVKTFASNDFTQFIKTVPPVVLKDYKYLHSIIYHIISTHKIRFFGDLKNYGLHLTFDFDRYKVLNFDNKQAWIIAIDLLISKAINSLTLKYISGENFIIENDPDVLSTIGLLKFYINALEFTEIYESTKHHRFYLNYLEYANTNDEECINDLTKIYDQLEKPYWFYTHCFCQILNHKKEFHKSLNCLVEYENSNGELHAEFYLFKSVALHFLERGEEIEILFNDYLNSIEIIDERHLFNLINVFDIIKQHIDDESKFIIHLDKALRKKFIIADLKTILKSTVELKHNLPFDLEEIFSSLNSIKGNFSLDSNCKNLIAENFDRLGKPLEALNFMDTYIDKSVVSESLRLYIFIIHSLLQNKEDTPKGKGKELLELLEFWRNTSDHIDEQLLCLEHDLCARIHDLNKLGQIDKLLFSHFPNNKKYLYWYLATLEMTNNCDEIIKISSSIPDIFENEEIGLYIAGVLLRNKKNIKKGFKILYNLASDKNNAEARMNYFGTSLLFNDYFKNFDTVEIGHWVVYLIDDRRERLQITKSTGLQKELLGKKIGETFSQIHSMTKKTNIITVAEIFNDALNLFREIEEEAKNPANDLGLYSLQIPPDINDFTKFLVEQFGTTGSEEKIHKDKFLDDYYNYRIGYLVVVNAVFKRNFVEAYLYLTGNNRSEFITVPNIFTAVIDIQNQSLKFVLDFTSLMLFYFLEKQLKFEFKHTFIISYNTRRQIESYINSDKNSPESTLSMNITTEGVENFFYPEGNKQTKIDFLQSILEWINKNCQIDLVEEKLDVILKLQKKENDYENAIINNMIDSLHLSLRENHRYISSDVSVFQFRTGSDFNTNFLNPEKYLLTYYPEKCNSNFYRFLLKSNYLGININYDTLKNEFIEYIGGRENYYLMVLENLQFSINNNPNVISTCIKFFNFLNNTALPLAAINKHASEVLIKSMVGMEPDLIIYYRKMIKEKLKERLSIKLKS